MSRVLYLVFEKAKRYTLDPFWINLFDRCSRGTFPPQIQSFHHQTYKITFVYQLFGKRETFSWTPKKKNSLRMYRLVRRGLGRVGIFSPTEIRRYNYPIFRYTKWNQIKSKVIKEEFVMDYVKRKHPNQPNKFYEIMTQIQMKHIVATDLEIKDGHLEIRFRPVSNTKKPNFPVYERATKPKIWGSSVDAFTDQRKDRMKGEA
jgi:hypothetical protein